MLCAGRVLGLVAAALLAAGASAKLCGCSKDVALRITNVYENGDTDFHYDYCENLGDGRGITAGIAGFCTGTADAWQVIQEYHKLTGGKDDFSPMDSVLAKYAKSGSDSAAGLERYCDVWGKLGKSDVKFQHAQDLVRDKLYYVPSQEEADKLRLKLDISRAFLYDTGIQHGTGSDGDGLKAVIREASQKASFKAGGSQEQEIAWLRAMIETRDEHLKNPKEKDNQGGNYWAQTTYRTKSYKYAIDQKEYMFGTSVKILDNDGKPMTVKCQLKAAVRRRDAAGVPAKIYRQLAEPSGPPASRRPRPPLQQHDSATARGLDALAS
ncbi:hypothetical protein H4R18_003073 [Coemansia javaensis]|uniref:Chitosanase n=1 Tax=Coemansia javaensis TaxID=2761396 RepID=A0A9W8HD59_9FUNG|nr:hypothetical protein H4R18_003073 [Coemansia javaensis]